jgi:hypothetical protein
MKQGIKERQFKEHQTHRDFRNVRKVDTHLHHSACMSAESLLEYVLTTHANLVFQPTAQSLSSRNFARLLLKHF